MRINNVLSGRIAFYDRNPKTLLFAYQAASIAPHAQTSRWAYTVPTSRRFQGNAGELSITRQTAAAPVGVVIATIFVTPVGFSAQYALQARTYSNVIDGGRNLIASLPFPLVAGDAISCFSSDASSSGLVDYDLLFNGTEFDA